MVQIKSDIVQKSEAYLKDLERKAEAAVLRAMIRTSLIGEKRVKGIMEREAYDTGRLLRSITSEIQRGDDEIKLILGTNLEYAVMIEEGRKPGKWPNLDALVAWVGRRLRREGVNTKVNVTFDQLKALATTGRKPATKQQQAYRKHLGVVYMVGKKIATKGIRGKYIFKRIEEGLLAWFQKEVQKELSAI